MDFGKILTELRQEKAAIEQAILSIEKLAGAHRGDQAEHSSAVPRKRGRPKGSKNRPASPAVTNAAGGSGTSL